MTLRKQIKREINEAKNARGRAGAEARWHPYRKHDNATSPDRMAAAHSRHKARMRTKRLEEEIRRGS